MLLLYRELKPSQVEAFYLRKFKSDGSKFKVLVIYNNIMIACNMFLYFIR